MKPTGSLFQGIGSSCAKFSQLQSETYDLGPKIAQIKKNMEEDQERRANRAKIFQSAISIFAGGMQILEAQKNIDIGQTLTEGAVPERGFMDNLNTFLGGPSGDPTGKFGAIGESAGDQGSLERLLEMSGSKGTIPNPTDYSDEFQVKSNETMFDQLNKIFMQRQ